jgi:hypothetical protein
MNFKQMKEIEQVNKNRILKICPNAKDTSGIYIFTRYENGFKYAYIGQAQRILTRLAQHLSGYTQHIDISLKKHKLWSVDNLTGWKVAVYECSEELLNEKEQEFIIEYANKGYQLRNKTGGSQGSGKFGIAENKEAKGYRQGIKSGKESLQKELRYILDKYLVINLQKENKLSQNALKKFYDLLGE